MNSTILVGRITAKPEIQYTPSQVAVTKFTIAVDRPQEGADFIRVTAFGKRAEAICRYMDKGREIAVRGHIQTGSYKNREGKTIYTQDIIIDEDLFIGGRQQVNEEQVKQDVEDLFGFTQEGMPF